MGLGVWLGNLGLNWWLGGLLGENSAMNGFLGGNTGMGLVYWNPKVWASWEKMSVDTNFEANKRFRAHFEGGFLASKFFLVRRINFQMHTYATTFWG